MIANQGRGRGAGRSEPMPLPPEQVKAVWDLGEWTTCQRTARGSSNLSYFIDTDAGRFVLRLSNDRKTEAGMRQEVTLLDRLSSRGLPVPRVVPTRAGEAWARIGSGLCLVTVRLPGGHGDPRDAGHARESGRVLARFHQEGRDLPADARPLFKCDLQNLTAMPAVLAQSAGLVEPLLADDDVRDRFRSAVASLSAACTTAVAAVEGAEPWPVVVTHGSLGSTAVLFHEGQLSALLDIERAADEARALDLAYTIRGYTRASGHPGLDLGRITAVMDGYREVEPVPEVAQLSTALRVQRLLKIRRKAANLASGHASGPMQVKDGMKFLEILEDEVARIGWLEEHDDEVGEALGA